MTTYRVLISIERLSIDRFNVASAELTVITEPKVVDSFDSQENAEACVRLVLSEWEEPKMIPPLDPSGKLEQLIRAHVYAKNNEPR